MDFKDYYTTLGVAREASAHDIQRAYRQLARQYHPDLNASPEAEEHFKEIGEAYEVLKDPDKRAKYDRYGAAWKAAQQNGGTPPPGYEDIWFDGGQTDLDDILSGFSPFFEQLFGTASRQHAGAGRYRPGTAQAAWQWQAVGQDHEARVSITLEEAYRGGQRQMTLTDPGTGQSKTLTVRIPPGVRHGQRLRVPGQGGRGAEGTPPGDLYLLVMLLPHPTFRVEDDDLYTTLAISPWEAALGASVQLATLGGTVQVKIPAGSSSGSKIRLRGKGFPTKTGAGDLYAEIRIMVPKPLSVEERQGFERLAQISHFRPRP